jgi:hypothetical protein
MLEDRETGHAHITRLRDKAEDAVVLLVEGPHVCRFLAARGSELACECLLCDLRQVAEAKQDSSLSRNQHPEASAATTTHKKRTLRTTPSPETAR